MRQLQLLPIFFFTNPYVPRTVRYRGTFFLPAWRVAHFAFTPASSLVPRTVAEGGSEQPPNRGEGWGRRPFLIYHARSVKVHIYTIKSMCIKGTSTRLVTGGTIPGHKTKSHYFNPQILNFMHCRKWSVNTQNANTNTNTMRKSQAPVEIWDISNWKDN